MARLVQSGARMVQALGANTSLRGFTGAVGTQYRAKNITCGFLIAISGD
jgi:hypothetical protein